MESEMNLFYDVMLNLNSFSVRSPHPKVISAGLDRCYGPIAALFVN